MLNKRYQYDGKSILKLNKTQLENKKIVEEKIRSKQYKFEKVYCVICGSSDFELLAEKDRYGLPVTTVICKNCGLLQTNPRMTQQSYNDFYESNYRKLYVGTETPTNDFFNNQITHGKAILHFIEEKTNQEFTNKFVVEIGTGAGGILKPFKDKENEVLGLDLGSEYIEFGRNKGIPLKVGTIKELEKLKEKPDLVIYSHVLEHILNPYEELSELRKHLKETSLLYIEVPGVKNLIKSYNQDFLRYLQNAHVYHFSLTSLKNLTKKAGFDLIYGNEVINSIFKIGKASERYENDYNATITFLKNLERKRKNPFNLYRLRNFIFSSVVLVTKKTGTFEIAKKFIILSNIIK